jgi:hypothetical protein
MDRKIAYFQQMSGFRSNPQSFPSYTGHFGHPGFS